MSHKEFGKRGNNEHTADDHIGVAVADLDKYLAIFGDLLGLEVHYIEEADPYEGLRIAFA